MIADDPEQKGIRAILFRHGSYLELQWVPAEMQEPLYVANEDEKLFSGEEDEVGSLFGNDGIIAGN